MANDYADKELPRAKDQIAPAVYDENKEDWVVVRGRDGRQWVRDDSVESQLKELNKAVNGNSDKTQKVEITNDTQKARPVDGNGDSLFTQDRPGAVSDAEVLEKLKELETVQNKMANALKSTNDLIEKTNDRLDKPLDTNAQLTGSKVEDSVDDFLTNQSEIINALSDSSKIFGVYWDKGSDPELKRTDAAKDMGAKVGVDGELVDNEFDNAPIYRDIGEVSDKHGNVFISIPKFYIRKRDGKDFKLWQISETKYPGFYLPKVFWDFENEKELDYFLYGKHEASLSDDDELESKPDKQPLVEKSIVEFRDYAEENGKGYQQNDIHAIDVLQTLFYVEFATLNSQSILRGWVDGNYSSSHKITVGKEDTNQAIVSNDTASDYEVGQTIGIGDNHYHNQTTKESRLITKIEEYDDDNTAIHFDGDAVDIEEGDVIANRAWLTGFSQDILASSGVLEKDNGRHPIVYRGIENPWGSIYEFIDGININDQQAWVAEDARDYESNVLAKPYKKLGYENHDSNGYVKEMGFDPEYPFAEFPVKVNGSTSTYYADYYYRNGGKRIARFGGAWGVGSKAGLSFWTLSRSSGFSLAHSGGRLLMKPL